MRIVLYGVIAAILFTIGGPAPAIALAAFLVLFTVTRVSAGAGAVPRLDLYAAFVPRRRRARFIAHKAFFGGLAAFGGGLIVQSILATRRVSFPGNFGLLFVGSTLCFLVATAAIRFAREPPARTRAWQRSLGRQFAYARTLLGSDARHRRYVIMRGLLSMIRIGSPFYVVYALDRLDAPASIAGTYLSMLTFARILSNPLWGRVLRRRGLKFVLQSANLLLASSAFLTVGLPALIGATGLTDAVATYAFGSVLLVQGLALGAHNVSLLPTLYEMAPTSGPATSGC